MTLLAVLPFLVAVHAAEPGPVTSIAATGTELVLRVDGPGPFRVTEIPAWAGAGAPDDASRSWMASPERGVVRVARYDGPRDRLYSAFRLDDPSTGAPLGPPRYVTDLSRLPSPGFDFPRPRGIKGITCPVDPADILALGVKYINTNVTFIQMFDLHNPNPVETYEVDGERLPINTAYFEHLDDTIRFYTDAGIDVTVVLNNPIPTVPDPANPFIHPGTNLAEAPNHLGAFNLTDARGYRYYRGALEYMAQRYSRPDRAHGWITGYIVGNELQAHWAWYNQGDIAPGALLDEYVKALRVADLAVRSRHPDIRTYVSMDHHWTSTPFGPTRSIRGDEFLTGVAARARAGGDFPWHVAFHPYPQDLFKPAFWKEKTTILSFRAPKITFNNLEVLPAYLRQEPFLFEGKPRRIILSEQGFHAAQGAEGEQLQAAAYAAAWYKVSRLEGIDAFMLHRHVSTRDEGGLRLGLWTGPGDDPGAGRLGRKLPIYDVFRLADTPQWREAFAFALPVIGIADWSALDPRSDISPTLEPADLYGRKPEGLILDLWSHSAEARLEHVPDWRPDLFDTPEGPLLSLFHHPPEQGPGDATFTVALPSVEGPRKLVLRFGTGIAADSTDGVRFAVLVDGQERWSAHQPGREVVWHAVDLTPCAGRTVALTLRTEAGASPTRDWAEWVVPQVVAEAG